MTCISYYASKRQQRGWEDSIIKDNHNLMKSINPKDNKWKKFTQAHHSEKTGTKTQRRFQGSQEKDGHFSREDDWTGRVISVTAVRTRREDGLQSAERKWLI